MDVHTIRVLRLRWVVWVDVSREGLGGRVPGREWGAVVALCGGVGVVQPNVGVKRRGVNTYRVHGLTISVLLMRWFKYSVDDFGKWENFGNAEFCVLERNVEGDKLTMKGCCQNETGKPVWAERRRKREQSQLWEREMREE